MIPDSYEMMLKELVTMDTSQADTSLKNFNETIEKWIFFLDDYTLEMLRQKPHPASWSLGQVYVHIIDDTKYFVEQLKASLASNANREKEMHETAHALFSNNAFPDMLLNGPATNSSVRQPHSKDELMQSLVSIRDEVNTLYSTVDFSTATGKRSIPVFSFSMLWNGSGSPKCICGTTSGKKRELMISFLHKNTPVGGQKSD